MVFTADVKEETQLGPTVLYSALVNVVIVINVIKVIDANGVINLTARLKRRVVKGIL